MNTPQAWKVKGGSPNSYPHTIKKYLHNVVKMYLCEAYLFLPEIFQGFDQQITSIVYLEKKKKHTK